MAPLADSTRTHHVYLIPGLFGFASLAGYDYFAHLETAIAERFAGAGVPLRLELVPSLPTASIPARAALAAQTMARTAGRSGNGGGPIHLVGHSSGGLDARLLLSPGVRLPIAAEELAVTRRVRTLVGINTPHYGTPLAAYFSTVSGTRFLYLLSLLTVTSLSLGQVPLSALAGLVGLVKAIDAGLGLDIRLIDDLTENVLRVVGEQGRGEIRAFLTGVQEDQSGILQLMPEVAELFNATVQDSPDVRYGSVATSAPPPTPRRVLGAVLSPMNALHLAAYTTLHGVASQADRRYPYAAPTAQQAQALARGLRREIRPSNVDGVVPTLSMLWGELIWCGAADHLDIVGHFGDDTVSPRHVDWLRSGAGFNRHEFAEMVDALCAFMLSAES
jgi:triacylglycerol lipase